MEQMLQKMARQLDAVDESSLMALWDKYAEIVSHFEPSKRWEESVLVLSLIQAKHWKNQLFNQRFAASVQPFERHEHTKLSAFSLDTPPPASTPTQKTQARVLAFKPRQKPESPHDPE